MTRRRLGSIGLAVVCLLAPWSAAQPAAGGAAIDTAIGQMVSDDAEQIRLGRNIILDAIKKDPSVASRQALNVKVIGKLREYAASPRDVVSCNALRVAGELATADAVALVGDKLTDNRDPVRSFAAAESARILVGLRNGPAAVELGSITTLIDQLGARVAAETNGYALHANIRALIAGTKVERPGFEPVRARALSELCVQTIARKQVLGPWPQAAPQLPALIHAQTELRSAQNNNNPQFKLTQAQDKAVVEMNAHLLGWVVLRNQDFQSVPAADRQQVAQLIRVAEQTILLGCEKYSLKIIPPQLDTLFLKATAQGDREFFQKALDLINRLGGEPFKIAGIIPGGGGG